MVALGFDGVLTLALPRYNLGTYSEARRVDMMKYLMGMMLAVMMGLGIAQAGEAVNINTATAAQLQSVKGIGVKTAAAIVAYREAHGDFSSLDAITGVKGIGAKKLAKIRDAITLGDVSKKAVKHDGK